jgi:hypothetical protein
VGILVGGRLVSAGRLADMVAFTVTGWELIMANVDPAAPELAHAGVAGIRPIADGRCVIELTPDAEPERLAASLRERGARLVSLNPLRATLEDFFVQVTTQQEKTPEGRRLEGR